MISKKCFAAVYIGFLFSIKNKPAEPPKAEKKKITSEIRRIQLKLMNNKGYFVGWGGFVPQMQRSFILDFGIKFGRVK